MAEFMDTSNQPSRKGTYDPLRIFSRFLETLGKPGFGKRARLAHFQGHASLGTRLNALNSQVHPGAKS